MSRPVFREILLASADVCSRRVAERALLANRTARIACNAESARRAYAAKARALEHGIEHFGERWSLVSLERNSTLVGVRHESICLHLPLTARRGAGVERWLEGQRSRIVADWQRLGAASLAA